jgi:hypothetical protein
MNDAWSEGYYRAAFEAKHEDYRYYAAYFAMSELLSKYDSALSLSGLRDYRIGEYHSTEVTRIYITRINNILVHLTNSYNVKEYYAGFYAAIKDEFNISSKAALSLESSIFEKEKELLIKSLVEQVKGSYNPAVTSPNSKSFSECVDSLLLSLRSSSYSS